MQSEAWQIARATRCVLPSLRCKVTALFSDPRPDVSYTRAIWTRRNTFFDAFSDPTRSLATVCGNSRCDGIGQDFTLIKRGQAMLADRNFAPRHLTEFASALATVEMYDANLRRSRQLFRTSLVEPNDNSLAQAAWAARRDPGVGINEDALDTSRSNEARAWHAFLSDAWADAVHHCEKLVVGRAVLQATFNRRISHRAGQHWRSTGIVSLSARNRGDFLATTPADKP